MSEATESPRPTIRFVSGAPTDEEIAAVTAVVLARAAAASGTESPAPVRSMWGRPAHVRHARPRSWAESRLPRYQAKLEAKLR